MSAAFLAHIEIGDRLASLESLTRLAKALKVPVWQLLAPKSGDVLPSSQTTLAREIAAAVRDLDTEDLALVLGFVQRLRLGPGPRKRSGV